MTLPAPVHDARIDQGRVCAWDDLIAAPALRQLIEVLRNSPYTRSEIARPDTAEYRHWALEIPLDLVDRITPGARPTASATSRATPWP